MRFSAQMKMWPWIGQGVASWVDRVKAEIMGIDVDGMEYFLLGRLVVLYMPSVSKENNSGDHC